MEEADPLTDALVQSAFETIAVLSRVSAEHDLSLTLVRVLGILRDRRLRISALAGFLGLERSTLSGLVDRAARRGLVERLPSASDRRAVEIALTAAGRQLATSVAAEVRQALAPHTASLAPADRRRLQQLLERTLTQPGTGAAK
ncbi:MarR family transcriptional regulator [Conexibacter sp. JD483]|uniref:MarR family winged helix-turn-helix transcriptional regulator n=1 Tax=unclassified Conexibacter TaxID=2627773 RepID=UPI0027229B01|nr:MULTISPECIES: MarR family transcriptional regulator [unclassified Conexibacter]MDO8189087.1 MarR family transcriptional regulator [Conexibacter sp. CPCC 205706]MDO8201866.1 MarR family transcriptional regulator [Conexibacter sp. CPCC 205762]MDR9372521.1 MarR family transcriptional regulator [Conexibacter sp. JD483]